MAQRRTKAAKPAARRSPTKAKEPADLGIPDPGRVIADQPLWASYARIGGNLTPQVVSEILRQADCGYIERLVDLANECRQKEGTLQSVLFTREAALGKLEWELWIPGQKEGSSRGNPQKRFVDEVLRGHDDFVPLLAHLTGAAFHGHAVAETDWTVDRKGRMVPKEIVRVSQRRFGFRQSDGKLIQRDHSTGYRDVDFQDLWPSKFIVSQPRINGDIPAREGLSRLLVWYALFRNWSLADWLKLAELAWKPYRWGKFLKKASDKDRVALEKTLARLTTTLVAALPESVDLHVEWPKNGEGGKSAHGELMERLGAEMAKAVLGQTLTAEQGKVGSQALGNVHNEVRKDILEFDTRHVAQVITRDLIRPLVVLNYGPNAPVPVLRFVTEDSADMLKVAQSLDYLCGPNVGMKIPAAWARDELGIPAPEENEEILGEASSSEDDEAESEDGEDEPPSDDKDEEAEKPKKGKTAPRLRRKS